MARLNRQTVPLRTFETKIMAELPRSTATVRSQGPLSRCGSEKVWSRFPDLSSTRIEPCGFGLVGVPTVVCGLFGTLPTSTNPLFKTASPVSRPRLAPWVEKRVCVPFGAILTMVVPVPCRLVLLLKLETRMSPGVSRPPDGNPLGTNATPYGFTSPFAGTVETVRSRVRLLRIEAGTVSERGRVWIAAALWTDSFKTWPALSSSRDSRGSQTGRVVLRCDRRFSYGAFLRFRRDR